MRKGLLTILALVMLAGTATASGKAASSTTAAGSTTVELFSLKPEVQDIMEKLIGDFEAQNPGVVIQQTVTPDAWGVLRTRLMGGDTPEIFMSWGGPDFRMWVANGYLADLTGIPAVANVSQDALDALRINGRDYIIPIARNVHGLWINVDLFKQCNLTPPTTWAEMMRVCEAFKTAGITPALIGGKELWGVETESNVYFLTIPSWPALDSDVQKKTVDFADRSKPYYQDIRDMAQRVIQWYSYAQPDPMGAGVDQLRNDFAIGKGAMNNDGSWAIAPILAVNPNLNFKMIPYPAVNPRDTKVGYAADDFALAYSSTAKHPDIAKKFLEFMTTKDAAQYYAEQSGTLSCIKGVNYSSPYLKDVYDFINAGNGYTYPNYEWSPGQMDEVGVAFQGLYTTKNIEAFCQDLQGAFNSKD